MMRHFVHQKEALVRVLFSFHRDCIFYMPVLCTANSLSRTDARFCKYICSLAITAVRAPAYESPVGHQKKALERVLFFIADKFVVRLCPIR